MHSPSIEQSAYSQDEWPPFGPEDKASVFKAERIAHWDGRAVMANRAEQLSRGYRRLLERIYVFHIPPNQRVLELGCGKGDLLAALNPSRGVGIDFCPEMIRQARERHPHLHFSEEDVHCLEGSETFDYIILSDIVNDLWDLQVVLRRLGRFCTRQTKIMMNYYSRIWDTPQRLFRALRILPPALPQSWLTTHDLNNLLSLSGFETQRHWADLLCPVPITGIATFCNRFLAKIWPLNLFCLCNFMIARPKQKERSDAAPRVSVVVPARNEAGNIANIIKTIPEMGSGTEIIFVEGHSQDNTWEVIQEEIARHPERLCLAFQQKGRGKGDAVRLGFTEASGDILMILDADLTVPADALPRFYQAILDGEAEFVNGVRLVYPMQERAMRFLNLVGNKIFSAAFTWLLGQPIRDTLCGTKVLWTKDYKRIADNRSYFGSFDPFGDFDLLFGAAKLNLCIKDIPIRYQDRTYGDTNIHRWSNGLTLVRMMIFAAKRIKFV